MPPLKYCGIFTMTFVNFNSKPAFIYSKVVESLSDLQVFILPVETGLAWSRAVTNLLQPPEPMLCGTETF
jgi:hypothetical protein